MFTRRRFLGHAVGGTVAVSTGLGAESAGAFLSSTPSEMLQEPPARPGTDWMNESRWGKENWKVTRQKVEWPNKARIAFLCSIPFESYDIGEYPGAHSGTVSEVLYGGKVGVWRIMD